MVVRVVLPRTLWTPARLVGTAIALAASADVIVRTSGFIWPIDIELVGLLVLSIWASLRARTIWYAILLGISYGGTLTAIAAYMRFLSDDALRRFLLQTHLQQLLDRGTRVVAQKRGFSGKISLGV